MIYFLGTIMVVHGLLHLLGFANAFEIGAIAKLESHISKPVGLIWLCAGLLFIGSAVFIFSQKDNWWSITLIALLISQILIIIYWKDAKFGTIANVIILIPAIIAMGQTQFENNFKKDVKQVMERTTPQHGVVTEADLQHLPEIVQRYLRTVGVVNKPKIYNMRLVFSGEMRQRGNDYFTFTSEQYNFYNEPARFFYMKADLYGTRTPGYHRYVDEQASMDIRLFGIIPMVRESGGVMNKTETVTYFNDLCLFAPAALIEKRIQWNEIDPLTVEATFHNKSLAIKAVLYFNDQGQLINFLSYDRTEVNEMKELPFSTPVASYQEINGLNLCTGGDARWHYPDEIFTYGKFSLVSVEYNVNHP